MSELKAAIIGCGGRAHNYATGFEEAQGVTCACCADRDRERADGFRDQYGLKPYYDAMEMLELEAPDIVAIVTKEGPRAALTRMCAEKRIPAIIAEKPMARTLDEARDMVRVCEDNGTILTVSHQLTFSREYELLKECIDSGELGEMRFMRGVSYGQLMEQGPHMMDMVLWLHEGAKVSWVMGQAKDTAEANTTVHPAPVFSLGYVVFDDDVRVVMECGRSFQSDPEIEGTWMQKRITAIGTEGIAEAVIGNFFRKMNDRVPGWQRIDTGVEAWNAATPRFFEELVHVLNEGGTHRNNAERSLAGFEAIQAIYQSVLDREAVYLPLPDGARPLEELLEVFGVEPEVE